MTRLTKLGFIVAIAGGLLAVVPLMADPFVLIKLLALALGGTAVWAGLFNARLKNTVLDRPLAALWCVMILSAVYSADPPASVFGMYPQAFYGLLPLFLCTTLYYAAAQMPDEASKDDLLRWTLMAAIPLTAYGISQRFLPDFLMSVSLQSNRIASTIGAPVMLGACLVLLTPLALHWVLTKNNNFGRVCAALIAAALLMTWARGAWLSAALAAAAYLSLTGRLPLKKRHMLGAAILAPLFFFILQRGLKKLDSDRIRVESLKASISAIAARPLIGYGPDAYEIASRRFRTDGMIRVTHLTATIQSSAHDDILQVAVTLGLLGLAAYAWLLWALGARLFVLLSAPDKNPRDAAVAAALLGLFLQAKFNPIPPSALIIAALLAGLVGRTRKTLTPAVGRGVAALTAACCAAAFLLYARLCLADARFKAGRQLIASTSLGDAGFMTGVNTLRISTELNPWSLDYLAQRCDVIFRVAPQAPRAAAAPLIDKALALTADAVRLHPGNPTAHELRATALMLSSAMFGSGKMPEAFAEIKTASDQDPTFTFTLRRRMEIARAMGDKADYDRTRAVYDRVVKLTGEDPAWTPAINVSGPAASWNGSL